MSIKQQRTQLCSSLCYNGKEWWVALVLHDLAYDIVLRKLLTDANKRNKSRKVVKHYITMNRKWRGHDGKYRQAANIHTSYHHQHNPMGIEGILGDKKGPFKVGRTVSSRFSWPFSKLSNSPICYSMLEKLGSSVLPSMELQNWTWLSDWLNNNSGTLNPS